MAKIGSHWGLTESLGAGSPTPTHRSLRCKCNHVSSEPVEEAGVRSSSQAPPVEGRLTQFTASIATLFTGCYRRGARNSFRVRPFTPCSCSLGSACLTPDASCTILRMCTSVGAASQVTRQEQGQPETALEDPGVPIGPGLPLTLGKTESLQIRQEDWPYAPPLADVSGSA